MGALVRNLYNVNGRWKYRKAIPQRLRPHVDREITEFVRWLGAGRGQPSPEVLKRYALLDAQCSRLIEIAEKRLSGRFDDLGPEAIAHIIAQARTDLLEEDEDNRFDCSADELFESVKVQLSAANVAINSDPDRRWSQRQETAETMLDVWRSDYARGRISSFVREEVRDRCAGAGLFVDTESPSFRRLARSYLHLLIETTEATLKRQRGELVETPSPPAPISPDRLRGVPEQALTGLVVDWWKEAEAAGRSVSTFEAYNRAIRQFVDFVEHDDANSVTKSDVIRFKDHRLAGGASPKTVKDSDLAGLRALFRWGVQNGRMSENPADGVTVIAQKKPRGRPKGFTDTEARAILAHAMGHCAGPGESDKVAAAKRWVPWLCAYTGARVGELVQLRKQDIRKHEETWVISITPDAVTVKGGKFREVPMHPHLVELGFAEFASQGGDGFLFLTPRDQTEKARRGAWRTVKNRVREFVREVVSDPKVQPNHAWRHRLETLARTSGIRRDVTDAITGHVTPGVAAEYGDVTIQAMTAAIRKLPRYDVAGVSSVQHAEDLLSSP